MRGRGAVPDERRALLDLFLIEKAAYEIAYEAANRPAWIGVPLAGLARLVARITREARTEVACRTYRLRHSWQLDAAIGAGACAVPCTPIRSLCSDRTTARDGRIIRAFLPGAAKVDVLRRSDGGLLAPLERTDESGLFEGLVR